MAILENMPNIEIRQGDLRPWGNKWRVNNAFSKKEGMDFGTVFDNQVGKALATMLGGLDIICPSQTELLPKEPDVVEVGPVRIIGGIRPQNYDVGYRPDGVRFLFDSKTLNDVKSIRKNFQNMVNDLATEATTAHMRFPHAVVAFMVIIPDPCFVENLRSRFTRMLERLVGRCSPTDDYHKAEAVSLVLWNPVDCTIVDEWPPKNSLLRIENFSQQIQAQYFERYDGLPPHDKPSRAQKITLEATSQED